MKKMSQVTKNYNFWNNNENCNIYYINIIRISFSLFENLVTSSLASLNHMPRLLGSFRQLLIICHVSSHSNRHKRKLVKTWMEESNLSNHLIRANNVWNLAIIDNIDFKEKSFKFGNIYDVTRGNSHATLRMAFQA